MRATNFPHVYVCVGVIILDLRGKMLLIRSGKWRNQWVVPGGSIEWGETFEQAGRREGKEETGLTLSGVRCIGAQESVFPKDFHTRRHFVFINLVALTKGNRVKLNHEAHEYAWVSPRQALRKILAGGTRDFIRKYLSIA